MKAIFTIIFSFFFSSFFLAAESKPLTIGVIADVNGSACQARYPSNSTTAFSQLLGNHTLNHIIMTGDAVAGECITHPGTTPYATVVKQMWAEFEKSFVLPAREKEGVDIVLAPGNHDAPFLYTGSRENFRIENAEFVRFMQAHKPKLKVNVVNVPGIKDGFPFYWAYTYENVLFVVLHSTRTVVLSNSAEQKKWLRALFQTPEAKAARVKIAFGHVPPYAVLDPSVGGKYSEIIGNEQVGKADGLVDLLLDAKVDALLVGHSHAPFPGEITRNADGRKMKILSMPCGHAPRKLYSKTVLSPRGYAVLEIAENNTISMSLRNWKDGKPMPPTTFPAQIPMKDGKASYKKQSGF